MKNTVISVLKDETLLTLLETNISSSVILNLRERFSNSIKALESPKYILPVVGTQGTGKSSFINSIIFGNIVLPVDADETTCIPTEIMYGENESPLATVFFRNGEEYDIECTEESLQKFSHQAINTANKLDVDHIRIIIKSALLHQGLILVDLPGLGSLTHSNVKTSMQYIHYASGAIFLISTSPPITGHESNYIQSLWPMMTSSFFIQNRWHNDSQNDVKEGIDHNLNVLKEIASKCSIPDKNISIDVVNVDQALKAVIRKDDSMLVESGLPGFINKLELFGIDWENLILSNIKTELVQLISVCEKDILFRIEIIQKDAGERKKELESEREKFQKELEEKKELTKGCFDFIREEEVSLKENIKEVCRISSERLRNDVRTVINNGVTVGDKLIKAFTDFHKEQVETIFTRLQPRFITLSHEVNERIDDIEEFYFRKVEIPQTPEFADRTQIHAAYKPILASAAGISGMIGGAELGASIGALFGGVGAGPGAVIGGAIGGLMGYLAGMFAGNAAKEFHLDKQKEDAREELFKLIEAFRKESIKNYEEALTSYKGEIFVKINYWMRQREEEFNEREETIMRDALKTEEEKEKLISQLNKNSGLLGDFLIKLKAGETVEQI